MQHAIWWSILSTSVSGRLLQTTSWSILSSLVCDIFVARYTLVNPVVCGIVCPMDALFVEGQGVLGVLPLGLWAGAAARVVSMQHHVAD